jgi:penicillin-binding protein 2
MSRLVVFRIGVILAFLALVNQLYTLQFQERDALEQAAHQNTFRQVYERPLRGEIFASDGETLLAESRPSQTIAILPSQLPRDKAEQQKIFAWLDDLLHLQSTIVVTPSEQLTYEPRLQQEIEQITGPFQTPEPSLTETFAITVPLERSQDALQLTRTYSTSLEFHSPIRKILDSAALPAYETVPLTTTTDLRIGRVIEETKSVGAGLPGVQVEQNYQRSYPKSGETQSLSHILGYVGTFDQCDTIRQNPPRFWPRYITDQLRRANSKTALLESCGISPEELERLQNNDAIDLQYLLTDRIGRAGLERSYEAELRGQLGEKQVEVDVNERLVSEPRQDRETRSGDNLVLTIDYELQKRSEEILRKWIAEADRRRQTFPAPNEYRRQYFPIEAGVAIALEVKTGRVLSMVSWPSFDNNLFNRPISQDEAKSIFDPGYPRQAPAINQAIQGRFPPGSTWKQMSAAAALENGVIGPDSKLRDPGLLRVKNAYFENDPSKDQIYPNSIRRDNGWIDVRQALQVSSNVFFQSVMGGTEFVRNLDDGEKIKGLDETGEKQAEMAREFGFGEQTGIPLPFEDPGVVPSRSWKAKLPGPLGQEAWTIGDTYNVAIGQGDLRVTPIQLAVASAAVANGGTLYQPQLVRQITDVDGNVVREIEPVVNDTLDVAPEHLQTIRQGMYMSVNTPQAIDVCARKDVSGLDIAGKTGTAEYVEQLDPNIREYREENFRKRSHAWFVGFAPYDDPEIQVLVLVEGAGDMNDGSATIAVPAVTEIMQAYYKVPPPQDPAMTFEPYDLPCH